MNWVKSLRNSVNCPFCNTGYTFASEKRRQAWISSGRKEPLHPGCRKAAKRIDDLVSSGMDRSLAIKQVNAETH